ncbi:MAG: hypothetical protein H6937_04465 [Burkholderiales bacterium]|nr:hypothetical protein [Burkholderiales bacterium]
MSDYLKGITADPLTFPSKQGVQIVLFEATNRWVTSQAVMLYELDGPHTRKVSVQIYGE